MRLRVLAALLALLTGCWTGDAFYRPSDARMALPPGTYRDVTASREETGRVSILPNGMTRLDEGQGSEPGLVGFSPLDENGRRYVMWTAGEEDGQPVDDTGLYWLLERNEAGEYLLFLPQCDRTEALARAAGATIDANDNGIKICHFPDRASLESAMREYHPDPAEGSRLVRTGD